MTRRFFFGSGALSGDLALAPPPEKNVPMFGAGPFFFDALDDAFFFGAPDLDPPPKRPLGSAPPWALACSSLATLAAWARAAFSPVGSAQSFAGPTFRPSRRTAACAELRKASPAAPSSAMSRAPSARSQSHKAPSAAAFAGATAYVDRKETASSSPAAPAASPDAQTATTRPGTPAKRALFRRFDPQTTTVSATSSSPRPRFSEFTAAATAVPASPGQARASDG
mmetsp:Transcript_14161/g.48733  ORF Transcript_14161/g.48733 Transcript_14161/m.48733 type:complete len:225 (+) Transcript_14161:435-1109(+)